MKIKRISYYLKIWWIMNIKNILPTFSHNWTFLIFLIGKVFRFLTFGSFIYFLLKGTNTLAGYNLNQALFFYVTFTFIDAASQFLFREVYRFRSYIISGAFDMILVKPINPLFRILLGGADAIDLLTLPLFIYLIIHFGSLLSPSPSSIFAFLILLINGFVIASAFHIVVIAMGIITFEIDHTVMIFRDLESLARFPVDIYRNPLGGILTYLLPIGVMITIPAKSMMGLISPSGIIFAILVGIIGLAVSLRFWNFALKRYTSASS